MSVGKVSLETSAPLVAEARRPRVLLTAGCVLLALFVLLGVAVAAAVEAPFSQHIDDWWRGVIGASPESTFYKTPVPMLFQYLGELPGAVLMFLVIPLGLTLVGRWRSALFFVSSWVASMIVLTQLVKRFVDRPRPSLDESHGLFGPLFQVDHGSFPSGHSVVAGMLLISVAALIPPARKRVRVTWWIVGGLVVLGMMLQRTLINAHWLSDTVAGVVAGAAVALLVWWAFWPLLRSDYSRRAPFRRRKDSQPADPAETAIPRTR